MPRPERRLVAGDPTLTRFASDLRALREQGGRPGYRVPAQRAHYSATMLSDAAGGRSLPGLAVTLLIAAVASGSLSVADGARIARAFTPLMLLAAVTRVDIANYVSALFTVYIILIFVYILLNLIFSLGARPPYARWSDTVLTFLRDVCEPYLRLFRRFIPPLGMFDFSPIIGIFVLYIVRSLVVSLIGG